MLTIPIDLSQTMDSGECVLFLGAGIGRHLSDENGKSAPLGSELAVELAAHFGIEADETPDLAKISQVIEIRKKGRKELHAFLQKRLANLSPDNDLQWLLGRPWKAIYTTNYDYGIERAYELNPNPVQKPVIATVTSDITSSNPLIDVPIYHLHGTLFGVNDPHIIITEDDYARFRERRRMLFELLKTEFATSIILYIGYSHNDSNWKILLNELLPELTGVKRPISYRVSPYTLPLDIEILKNKGVETLAGDLTSFVQAASFTLQDTPPSIDRLKSSQMKVPADLQSHFDKSPAAMARLLSSWTYVKQAPFNEPSNLKKFLQGDQANWSLIAKQEFFERDLQESIYSDLLDFATNTSPKGKTIALLGPAGYGMSTLLKTLAVELVKDKAGPVFMHKPGTPFLEGDVLYASSLFPEQRPFFCIDNATDYSSDILNCIYRLRDQERPVLFILADRLNQWKYGRGKLNASEFVIEPLSDPEIARLLAFLEKHRALNTLEPLSPELRFAAIKEKHAKELLVAMREASEGVSFDAIIEDEYVSIGNEEAKQVYLTVCCFYQHGALIRDGLLAELVNLSLTDLYQKTASATEGVVIYECNDSLRNINVARARHRTIATIVWERCESALSKEKILQVALATLNINFSSDLEAFEQFIRSDRIIDSIKTLEGRTKFFETAIKKDPQNPYVRQHYARMLMRSNRPELALSQIETALELDNKIRILYHTQGIVLSELAIQMDSTELARRRLAQAEDAFKHALNIYNRDEYSYASLAKLYLDWAKKVPEETTEYISKCEATISEGLKHVVSKESLWIVSANVQEWLGNEPGKIQDLERAVNDQSCSLFPRYLLARTYRQAGRPADGINVLKPVLKDNPTEFRLCIEYALCLDQLGKPYNESIAVLALGNLYGFSDSRFISIYGGMLFMNEQFTEADQVFSESIKRDFNQNDAHAVNFRPKDKSNPVNHIRLNGKVTVVRAGYAFIEVPGYPEFLCPSSKQHGVILEPAMQVSFQIGFSAKGAIAEIPTI